MRAWEKAWPGCSIDLLLCRPGEADTYPARAQVENGELVFWPESGDTQLPGRGTAYLMATLNGEQVGKSQMVETVVYRSGNAGDVLPEAPEAAAGWVADVAAAAAQARDAVEKMPKIVDGNWHAWNGEAYADTGVPATGPEGRDGYTPVRGTDYWTDADIDYIVKAVLAAIGGGGSEPENANTNELDKAILDTMILG